MTTPTLTLPVLLRVAGQVARRLTAAGLDVDEWSLDVDVRPGDGRPHLRFQIHGAGDAGRLAGAVAVARVLKAVFTVEEREGFCESIPNDYVGLSGLVTRSGAVVKFAAVLFSPEGCDQARATFPVQTALAGAA
jgi:hypothetical protein